MNYSKKWFITFGAGGDNYIDAGNRLIKQVQSLGVFDKTILYTENDLMQNSYFWEKHKNFIYLLNFALNSLYISPKV